MPSSLLAVVTAVSTLQGCLPAVAVAAPTSAPIAAARSTSLRSDRTRVVARYVKLTGKPEVSVVDGVAVLTFFGRNGKPSTLRLDPRTLDTVGVDLPEGERIHLVPRLTYPLARGDAEVTLNDNDALTFSTMGNPERGYRLAVELRGRPASRLFVTNAALDVLGSPESAKVDDHHALVAYYAMEGDAFSLLVSSVSAE